MDNDDDDDSGSNSSPEPDELTDENCLSLRGPLHSKKWMSKKSIKIIVLCSLLILVATTLPNIQWAFVILFFENQGASTIAISIYASCMSIFLLLTSLFSQNIMQLLPLKRMLILCVVVLCGSTCLHGILASMGDVCYMVVVGVVIRAIQGVSATLMQVLAVSILIRRFPEKCGRVSAVNESALGLGFSISPFIGGIIYDKVGFLLTFVLLGGCGFLMIGPLCATSYKNLSDNNQERQYSKIKWRDVLFLSPLLTCCLSIVCETCVDYVMALYVNDVFGEDATLTGLLLSALSLSSLLFAFFLGYFCDKFNPFLLGVIGCTLSCLGLLLMVPPPFLQTVIRVDKHQLVAAAIVTGLGQAMIWLHVLPAMLFVKTKCRDKPVNEKLSNLVSLLYIVATSTGEIAGSFLAGGLHVWCDYWQFFTILSATMLPCTLFCFVSYLTSTRSLSQSFDSIPTSSTSVEDSKDVTSLSYEVTSLSNA